MQPRTMFRFAAQAEAVTWFILLVSMALKYTGITDIAMRLAGSLHGLAFLTFTALTILVWINQGWSARTGLLGLLSSIVPGATIFFEKHLERTGQLEGPWRFRGTSEKPRTPAEHLLALCVRHPAVAALTTAILVAVVFALLLQAGPPNTWVE